MVFLLLILAVGMVVVGLSAIAFGMTIINVERGWTMVISGSVGASGGAILLGVALATQRLGRIASEMIWIRDRLATIGELTAETASWAPSAEPRAEPDIEPEPVAEPVRVDAANRVDDLLRPRHDPPSPPPPPPPPEPVPEPPPERRIVGQYSSGGNEYKMYADGSIDAMTPAGLRRFSSLEELRNFVAGGGERAS